MSGIQLRLPTILDRLQREVFTPNNEQLLNMVIFEIKIRRSFEHPYLVE